MKKRKRKVGTPHLPKFEKFLLKLQPLREGDVVLIRVQDWYGRHRKTKARVLSDEGDYYVFENLGEVGTGLWKYCHFRVKKKNIERRLYKIWRREELEGDEKSVNS